MLQNVCTLQSRFLSSKIVILRQIVPHVIVENVWVGKMETPATRKVCVGKMHS